LPTAGSSELENLEDVICKNFRPSLVHYLVVAVVETVNIQVCHGHQCLIFQPRQDCHPEY
jgi:hypothetical protein